MRKKNNTYLSMDDEILLCTKLGELVCEFQKKDKEHKLYYFEVPDGFYLVQFETHHQDEENHSYIIYDRNEKFLGYFIVDLCGTLDTRGPKAKNKIINLPDEDIDKHIGEIRVRKNEEESKSFQKNLPVQGTI